MAEHTGTAAVAAPAGAADRSVTGLETALAVAAAVVAMAAIAWMSCRQWFLSDSWDFITTREIGSVDDMLRPHAGHWQTPTAVAHRLLYGIFGMDYWPWYDGPRLLGHAALSFVAWRAMRWRGADLRLAFAAYLVLLFSPVSDWHRIATIGNFIAWPALIAIAVVLASRPRPERRDRWLLFALLVAALVSGGQGVAILGGTVATTVLARRVAAWWPSLLGATAVYGTWYAWYRNDDTASPELSLDVLVDTPRLAAEVLGHGIANSLDVPFRVGAVLAVALAAAVVWILAQRKMTLFEGTLLTTLATYLVLVVVTRVGPGSAQASAVRYAYAVSIMAIPALVPFVRIRLRGLAWTAAAVIIVAAWWPGVNQLEANLDFWEGRGQGSRRVVESAATMIGAGEPYFRFAAVDSPRSGPLTAEGLALLVEDGWDPVPTSNERVLEEARGNLRFNVRPQGEIRGRMPVVDVALDDNGCAAVAPGSGLPMSVTSIGAIRLDGDPGTDVDLVWDDRFGRGVRDVAFTARRGPSWWVTVPEADGPTTVTVQVVEGGPVAVCGLQSSTGSG